MIFKYYHGERNNPFRVADSHSEEDVRVMYWERERLVSSFRDPTAGVKSYPCNNWPDFLRRAKADLKERGIAFEIDFQNSKYNCGEYNQNWYSYFDGLCIRWQQEPFKVPEVKIDWDRYSVVDSQDVYGFNRKLIKVGPIVNVVYRGIENGWCEVPVFEIENLRGDRFYLTTPGFAFRCGDFRLAGIHEFADGKRDEVYIYDKRLHAALVKLLLDKSSPAICVGERLVLPTQDEVDREMRWYRV